MKSKAILIFSVIAAVVIVISLALSAVARFVFLSPSSYSDNANLTDEENYFIKKIVLAAVEDRLSVFAEDNYDIYDPSATYLEIIQLDETQKKDGHVFVWINTDFMKSVVKENGEYVVSVQTHYMEEFSDDCVYEIRMTEDYIITYFGLDA